MRFLIALVALALVGCGEEQLTSGYVVEKKHEDARSYIVSVPLKTSEVCTSIRSGTSTIRSCTPIYIWIPYHYTDDEDWILVLRNEDRKGGAFVSKERWDEAEIGKWWERDGGEAIDDPNKRGDKA